MSVGADTVTEFANIMGLGHMDQDTFLAAVRCYVRYERSYLYTTPGQGSCLQGLWITMWSPRTVRTSGRRHRQDRA